MNDLKIGVRGLADLNRSLRAVDAQAPKALRLALNEVADLLVVEVRPEVPSVTGRARRSYRARSTRTAARVSMGGRGAEYVPWLDFGGRTGPGRSVARAFYKEGRYLYPTLRKIRPRIETALDRALVDVARGAGLDVD